jgi:hypothetical protein
MKLCLMILSVPWYMFNGLEHTAIVGKLLIFITGSSSRLLSLQEGAGPRFGEKPFKTTDNLGLGPPICPLF